MLFGDVKTLEAIEPNKAKEMLMPGDRIKLYFSASDSLYIRATQQAMIEWRLESHPEEFELISIDAQQKAQLIFTVEIKTSAEKLFEEERISNLIIRANPVGFRLIFQNAVVEKVKEFYSAVKAPAAFVIVAALIFLFLLKK